jgi:hypothetical protein
MKNQKTGSMTMDMDDSNTQRPCCVLCQSSNVTSVRAYDKDFFHCQQCNFIFQQRFDREILKKGLGINVGENGGYREYYLTNMLKNDLQGNSFLLYGTGNTPAFDRLINENINVYGCDISRDLVAMKSKKYGKERFFLPQDIPAEMNFDGIIAVEVFEHFIEPLADIAFLVNHLSMKGVLCGTTDFFQGKAIEDKNQYMKATSHVSYWSFQSLSYAANKLKKELTEFEMIRPGSVLPDEKFGWLWPNKRVFFIYSGANHQEYFEQLKIQSPILPIDRP